MSKLELLRRLYDEKMDLYKVFNEHGHKDTADGYYWEATGLETAIKILEDDDYYQYRLDAYK